MVIVLDVHENAVETEVTRVIGRAAQEEKKGKHHDNLVDCR